LRFNPELWKQVQETLKGATMKRNSLHQQPLCRVSQYARAESDKGNTTLKMAVNGIKSLALLDT
ncbi:hypothetical protein, partial [Escherichia coli]|uniref:hypothetical protein n=1 Tax=Escherichia coli TaxID=562 RepID=UPI001AD908C4